MDNIPTRGRFLTMLVMAIIYIASAHEHHETTTHDKWIERVCSQTDYSRICETTIVPFYNGKNDPIDVLEMQLKAAIHETETAYNDTKHDSHHEAHHENKCYESCLNTYHTALDSFKNALTLVQHSHTHDIDTHLNPINHALKACNKCFTDKNGTVQPPLHHYGDYIFKMNTNCLNLRLMAQPEG